MLESTDTLWRYMKLSTFLMLLEGKAWFPSVASLRSGDPLEAALSDDFHEKLWRQLELQEGSDKAIELISKDGAWEEGHPIANASPMYAQVYGKFAADEIAALRAAWCWFKSDLESAAMWPIYGHQGVAVMTDRQRLRNSLPTGKEFQIRDIEYVDHRPSSEKRIGNVLLDHPDLALKPYFMKAVEYQHEKEVRVAAHCPKGMKGLMIAGIHVDELIREVVVSPLLPEDEADAIERIIRLRVQDETIPVRQSKLIVRSIASGLTRRFDEQFYGVSDDNIDLSGLPPALRVL